VAHDFNNFLTVIAGESELLLDQMAPDDPSRAAVQGMHDAGKRAALLTRQLLAFSRQQVLEPKILDLNQVVGDTERMLRRLLGEDILLRAELSAMVPSIKVDPGHLVQVLLNLAVNARDAMPRGGQLIIATGEAQRAPDPLHPQQLRSYVTLRMTDTGVGMGPEVQARLFEPFFTTKSVGKGTGLGLSVVHGIVSQSGGLVDVESTPGAGTTFTLYFPKSEAAGGESAVEMGPVRVRHRGTEELLVVEDEEPVRRLAVRTLRAAGYQVREAADGLKALELLNQPGQPPIDLLVTDLVMPNLSGRELAEEMAQRQPGIRVLYTSGYTDDAIVRHGILQAEVSFMSKPYVPLTLLRRVREVLDRA
jgi:CheY-like chemotaxis protein